MPNVGGFLLTIEVRLLIRALVTSLYVEKDLSAVCKAVFDQWETKKASLDGKYFLASGARETMGQINTVLEKGLFPVLKAKIYMY